MEQDAVNYAEERVLQFETEGYHLSLDKANVDNKTGSYQVLNVNLAKDGITIHSRRITTIGEWKTIFDFLYRLLPLTAEELQKIEDFTCVGTDIFNILPDILKPVTVRIYDALDDDEESEPDVLEEPSPNKDLPIPYLLFAQFIVKSIQEKQEKGKEVIDLLPVEPTNN